MLWLHFCDTAYGNVLGFVVGMQPYAFQRVQDLYGSPYYDIFGIPESDATPWDLDWYTVLVFLRIRSQ